MHFFDNLRTLFTSGTYRAISGQAQLTVCVAMSVCAWNALVWGYVDFDGGVHDPVIVDHGCWRATKVGLPMEAFALVSPSLGLLLGELSEV